MSDLVLLSMDRVKIFVENCIQNGKAEYDASLFNLLIIQISKISPSNSAEHDKILSEAVLLLDPSLDVRAFSADLQHGDNRPPPSKLATTGIPKHLSQQKHGDILFFRELMKPIEKRSMYWNGRGDRIAKLAAYVNKVAGLPIDEDQLAVACYMHDFGMAFMPIEILHKQGRMIETEFNLMRSHVYKSARLLEHLDHWDEARKIVMQHHERMDGSGYPLGLKEADTCDGAKLLGILDTFDAITHNRAHKSHVVHPKKRAVIEINRIQDGQFCPKWLGMFNKSMAVLLTK